LMLAQDIFWIPELLESGILKQGDLSFAYLARRFAEGQDILWVDHFSASFLHSLEKLVCALHSTGIARLDLVSEDFDSAARYKHNVLITPEDEPVYYDLGNCLFSDISRIHEFEEEKKRDLEDLEYIFWFLKR